jgi:hypothetical protein
MSLIGTSIEGLWAGRRVQNWRSACGLRDANRGRYCRRVGDPFQLLTISIGAVSPRSQPGATSSLTAA